MTANDVEPETDYVCEHSTKLAVWRTWARKLLGKKVFDGKEGYDPALMEQLENKLSEIGRLTEWKQSALLVLREWEPMHDFVKRHGGELGASIASETCRIVALLETEIEQLKAEMERRYGKSASSNDCLGCGKPGIGIGYCKTCHEGLRYK